MRRYFATAVDHRSVWIESAELDAETFWDCFHLFYKRLRARLGHEDFRITHIAELPVMPVAANHAPPSTERSAALPK